MNEAKTKQLEFDIRGQICPSSLLVALREINRHQSELKAGSRRIAFLTDNRDSTSTIPEAVENMGYEVTVSKEDRHYVILVGQNL